MAKKLGIRRTGHGFTRHIFASERSSSGWEITFTPLGRKMNVGDLVRIDPEVFIIGRPLFKENTLGLIVDSAPDDNYEIDDECALWDAEFWYVIPVGCDRVIKIPSMYLFPFTELSP